ADLSSTSNDISELVEQRHDSGPNDERADEVHVRRALQLSLQLRADRRLLAVIDEQLIGGQWDLRAIRESRHCQSARLGSDTGEQLGWRTQRVALQQLGPKVLGESVNESGLVCVAARGEPFRR